MKKNIILILIALSVIMLYSSAFIVNEGKQALVIQFGKIKGGAITKAGLYFKIPFIQHVRVLEKRILNWDGEAEQVPTKDKKYIWVDTTARWKIIDAVTFARLLGTEDVAKQRLNGILDGRTRDYISSYNLVEAVRNSNLIIDKLKAKKDDLKKAESEAGKGKKVLQTAIEEEEVTGEISKISLGREKLSNLIIKQAKKELLPFGIELIDVQLRRIEYQKSVASKVFDRMISERQRIAAKIRSIGKGEEAKILGKLNKDLKKIESTAYRKSQIIKGKAEAKAISIYAKSMKNDPDFYSFTRTLDAYKKTLTKKVSFILSTDSAFFKLFEKTR